MLALTIRDDTIHADYTGTRGIHRLGINAVANYAYAYTAYPIKCVFSPEVPNNDGGFLPITVGAPAGSILNAQAPAPLGARNITGNILHAVVFGALAQVVPERVQADCGSACWSVVLNGRLPERGEFVEYFFLNGGYGARATKDGPAVLSFPTNVANVPTEVLEHSMPVLVHEKSLRADSGGDGMYRGGLGQRVSFEWRGREPVNCSLLSEKTQTRAHGVCGGGLGAPGAIQISPVRAIAPKGLTILKPGDRLTLDLPGGGGYGDPARRDASARALDIREGYVTDRGET